MEIHELPFMSEKVDLILKNNMVVTDEPGIYVPNKFGIRIEDTVWINKGMATPLTKSPKDYIVVG